MKLGKAFRANGRLRSTLRNFRRLNRPITRLLDIMGTTLCDPRQVLKALEDARNKKQIGSSLEAKVILTVDRETTLFPAGPLPGTSLHLYRFTGRGAREGNADTPVDV